MIETIRDHNEKIVLIGQSCVGKTTFAKQLGHNYCCFDALFPWDEIELFDLSINAAIDAVVSQCPNQCILDGWHLCADIPMGFQPYVIYAPYDQIVAQYRVPLDSHEEVRQMFWKWYRFPVNNARYFRNDGDFIETTKVGFELFLQDEIDKTNA